MEGAGKMVCSNRAGGGNTPGDVGKTQAKLNGDAMRLIIRDAIKTVEWQKTFATKIEGIKNAGGVKTKDTPLLARMAKKIP